MSEAANPLDNLGFHPPFDSTKRYNIARVSSPTSVVVSSNPLDNLGIHPTIPSALRHKGEYNLPLPGSLGRNTTHEGYMIMLWCSFSVHLPQII